jgi:hypothetical protein
MSSAEWLGWRLLAGVDGHLGLGGEKYQKDEREGADSTNWRMDRMYQHLVSFPGSRSFALLFTGKEISAAAERYAGCGG